MQRSNTLNGFTIFAIRQALESAAKELLGLRSILRKDGKPDRGNTQLPWKFLVAHAQRPYFQFPFCAHQMQLIYQWANHFVHTGNDAMYYVTAKALRTVETLFGRMQLCYFDQQPQWVYTNVITDRQAMRRNLETFLLNLDAQGILTGLPTLTWQMSQDRTNRTQFRLPNYVYFLSVWINCRAMAMLLFLLA